MTRKIFVGPTGPTGKLIRKRTFGDDYDGNMDQWNMSIEGFFKTLKYATDCDGK